LVAGGLLLAYTGAEREGDATVTSRYMTNWREYQERVADLFRELGCSAEVEASVEGVRATHDIDVWVVFERFGLEHRWAIECKYWDAPIPKEKVLTLRSIVDDVGADKGLLVAESGFQPGAFAAATSTNVLLTTFADLRALAESDVQSIILEDLERRVITLSSRASAFLYTARETKTGVTMRPRPGVDLDDYLTMRALLGILEDGFRSVKIDQFPAPVGMNFDADRATLARNKREFIEMSGETIESVNAWVTEQEAAIESAHHGGKEST
jgi:hypothetical protein